MVKNKKPLGKKKKEYYEAPKTYLTTEMIANSLRNIMSKLTLGKKQKAQVLTTGLPCKCPVIAVLHKLFQKVEKKGSSLVA